jgi:hypothetical protein
MFINFLSPKSWAPKKNCSKFQARKSLGIHGPKNQLPNSQAAKEMQQQ